jgi:hypothetical protein
MACLKRLRHTGSSYGKRQRAFQLETLVPTDVPTGFAIFSKYASDLEPPYGIEP